MSRGNRRPLFRNRDAEDGGKVTNIELFFDLVFVFAVTQLSSRLLTHLTVLGAVETLVLFLAVWWLWIYTSWATNWLDPERGLVRAMLMAMMLGGLLLSAALPNAFAGTGIAFVLAYCSMQILRTLAIVIASIGVNRDRMRNFLRLEFYFLLSLPLWLYGAMLPAEQRLMCWAVALAIEYTGPFVLFATPFLGRSKVTDWDISGAHMAERCSLFIIIALGEAILVTGATFAGLDGNAATSAALVFSFIGSAAMWWVYFDTGAKRAGEVMEDDAQAGRLGRNAYTYFHMPIVAGVVVTAVADELMLSHPVARIVEHVGPAMGKSATETIGAAAGHAAAQGGLSFVLVACGGPLLFLFGNLAFKWSITGHRLPPFSHMIGIVLLSATAVAGYLLDLAPLTTGGLAAGALIATAVWEWFSLNGGWQRWAPWLGGGTAIALEEGER